MILSHSRIWLQFQQAATFSSVQGDQVGFMFDAQSFHAYESPDLAPIAYRFDVFTTQKSVTSLLLGGVDAVLIALIGLIVLAFYHPILLAFDLVLIVSAVIVLVPLGRGGSATSIAESKAKYAVAGWLEEMARQMGLTSGREGPWP